jgi:glycosyltransferase involved in cell wall biosynthesis
VVLSNVASVAIVCGGGIVSGKEIMALELAKGLRDKGCEVEVVTSYWGNGEFGRRSRAAGLPTHIMRLGFISATPTFESVRMTAHQMMFWPGLLANYHRFIKSVGPKKIIHTNWHHAMLLYPFLNRERDIYWVHEVLPDKPQYRNVFQLLARRVRCFVAVSNAVNESLCKLGIDQRMIKVIHNGIEDPVSDPARLARTGKDSVVGIVGQIGGWKGHEDLLNAFQVVLRTQPTAQLHVFGRAASEYEAFLRARATDLGIQSSIKWNGFIANQAEIYGNLAVLVVPSRSPDPLPTSAIEACFFEVPVVASRIGGLPEIIADGETGLLFESGDVDQLARHLTLLLGDPELRNKMGRKARERAISFFGHDRFVREFCEILDLTTANVAATSSIE